MVVLWAPGGASCARAHQILSKCENSKPFELDADTGFDLQLLTSRQPFAGSVASPRSRPATDRKRTALTVRLQKAIYFFPPAHPVVCWGARRRRAHARGMCCRQQGGKGAAASAAPRPSRSRLAAAAAARSHERAVGASAQYRAAVPSGRGAGHTVPRQAARRHWQQRGAGAEE